MTFKMELGIFYKISAYYYFFLGIFVYYRFLSFVIIYMYKQKFDKDYNLGIKCENKVLDYLNNTLEYNLNCNSKNCEFDFSNNEYNIELKTRNNTYKKYPSTMVGYNKIKIAEEDTSNKQYKFLFLFQDGLYCFDFEKDKYKIKKGGRKDRGKYEYKQYAFINISDLYLLTDTITN